MFARSFVLTGVTALAALVAPGCSGGKSEDPTPARQAQYADPPPSPIATEEVAKKLRTYFAEGELASDSGGGSSSVNVVGNPVWSIQARQEMFPSYTFETSEGWQDKCQDTVGRYLTDLAKQCADLQGDMAIGKVEPHETGFRIVATYTLPPLDTSDGRTGKIEIELKDHPDEKRNVVTVVISEEALGKQLPWD